MRWIPLAANLDPAYHNTSWKSESCSVASNSLPPQGRYSPWNSLGQNTGVGSPSLLQGIFLTQGSNPRLWHCRWILYQLSHQGSPRILEWVAYPFSSRSSPPRNWTRISCTADRFFTPWATKEILMSGLFDIYIYSILNSRYLVSTPTFLNVIFSYYILPCFFYTFSLPICLYLK